MGCCTCGERFTSDNVFTDAGWAETRISGMCERCFDTLMQDIDDMPAQKAIERLTVELFNELPIPQLDKLCDIFDRIMVNGDHEAPEDPIRMLFSMACEISLERDPPDMSEV